VECPGRRPPARAHRDAHFSPSARCWSALTHLRSAIPLLAELETRQLWSHGLCPTATGLRQHGPATSMRGSECPWLLWGVLLVSSFVRPTRNILGSRRPPARTGSACGGGEPRRQRDARQKSQSCTHVVLLGYHNLVLKRVRSSPRCLAETETRTGCHHPDNRRMRLRRRYVADPIQLPVAGFPFESYLSASGNLPAHARTVASACLPSAASPSCHALQFCDCIPS